MSTDPRTPVRHRLADSSRGVRGADLARLSLTAVLILLSAWLLVALLSSPRPDPKGMGTRTVFQPARTADPATALQALDTQLRGHGPSTSLTPDGAYWMLVELTVPAGQPHVLEIRHLRARSASFLMVGAEAVGSAALADAAALPWRHGKGGVVVDVPVSESGKVRLLASIDPLVPGVLRVLAWDAGHFATSASVFDRMGGVLMGACAVLALTMGLLAWRNRDTVAMLFGLTVLLMLRVAAFNHGWDLYWLGVEFPGALQAIVIRATLPLCAVVQAVLFSQLFRAELRSLRSARAFPLAIAGFALLALASPWIEHDVFLRTFWMAMPFGGGYMLYLLARVVPRTTDRGARLYALALVVTLCGMVAELGFLAGLWTTTVSASLFGAVLGAALNSAAIAERIYADRAAAAAAQARELVALKAKEDAYQETPIPLYEFSGDGRLRHWNVAFERMFDGGAGTPMIDAPWERFFGNVLPLARLAADGDRVQIDDLALPVLSHGERHVAVRCHREGDVLRGSIEDVTDRVLARRALQRMIDHDQLTGTLNLNGLRSLFEDDTASSGALFDRPDVDRTPSGGAPIPRSATVAGRVVALIDIVRFDAINELFGREAGDAVLRTLASRLEAALQPDEALARLGADTFVLVLPPQLTEQASERVHMVAGSAVADPVSFEGKAIATAVCVGMVPMRDAMSLEEAIGASQRAVERAKIQRGTGLVSVAFEKEDALVDYLRGKALVGRLARRLPEEDLFQVMQPIIELKRPDGTFSCEALVRMRDVNGDTISPARFIPAAERNGLMSAIDRWMLEQSCRWLQDHLPRLTMLDYVTVNLSGASLNDMQFHADVRAILTEHAGVASRLCFEITETVALVDPEWTTRFTDQLRSRGARVALDDFGAGYSSFGYLRSIPAQILKIDGAIIQRIATDSASLSILRSIRDIAADLGMRCVAEYAFDFATVRALRELDIDYGQGFALARPTDPSHLLDIAGGTELIQDVEVARYLQRAAGMDFTAGAARPKRRATARTRG